MALSETTSLLGMDRWAEIMGFNASAFNQVFDPNNPYPTLCNEVWCQEAWMGGVLAGVIDGDAGRILAREDIAEAIKSAEDIFASTCQFWPAPTWIPAPGGTVEEHNWPRPRRGRQWEYPPFNLDWGYIIEGGQRATDEILAGVLVTYPVAPSITNDVATITIPGAAMTAAGASLSEVQVFHVGQTTEQWRIRNLTMVQNPVTLAVTITGPMAYFVDPVLWANCSPLDMTATLLGALINFVEEVDILRVYSDTQQSQLVFRGGINLCTTPPCSEACQTACVTIEDRRTSQVRTLAASYSAGAWTGSAFTQGRLPDAVRVWYRAGLDLKSNRNMQTMVEQAIARLANTYLPEAPCNCEQLRRRWERDREEQDINTIDAALCNAAFGNVTRGSMYAWSVIKRLGPLTRAGTL